MDIDSISLSLIRQLLVMFFVLLSAGFIVHATFIALQGILIVQPQVSVSSSWVQSYTQAFWRVDDMTFIFFPKET